MKKLVIIPGGFHPFHAGHKALYDQTVKAFPGADVYVAATADTSSRPFPFELKQKLAKLAGIPAHRFIQVKSPFQAGEIKQHYDADNTILIFARSEKDQDQSPRPGGVKKNGEPAYLQPLPGRDRQPMSRHAYMVYLPTVQFGGMTSATEIRNKWPELDAENKTRLVNTLYPATVGSDQLTQMVSKIFDAVLGSKKVEEAQIVSTADGMDIVVDGLGTYDEPTLVSSLARDFTQIVQLLKAGSYSEVEKALYDTTAVQSKIKSLGQYDRFLARQGQRPIAKDKMVDISNEQANTTDYIEEKWSDSYKRSIDCDNPRGFSQRAHCASRKK